MLKLINITKTFGKSTVNEKTALNGIDLQLDKGDFVTILGSNGAGKSTLFGAIAGGQPDRADKGQTQTQCLQAFWENVHGASSSQFPVGVFLPGHMGAGLFLP